MKYTNQRDAKTGRGIKKILFMSYIALYRVYQGFRSDLGKNSKMIIFVSFLTTFNMSNSFWGS